jgi:iron complex outermembrane receptor protein
MRFPVHATAARVAFPKPVLRRMLSLSVLPLATTMFSGAALAAGPQTPPPSGGGWTPDIIVTGARMDSYLASDASVVRTPVPLIDVPQSIQVVTEDVIRDQGALVLADALRNVSAVVPSQTSEIVLANPIVRGFEAEIFVNGLIGYGDTAIIDPASLWAIERVEVAKGPASNLFGGGAGAPLGGLINLVTKAPEAGLFARAELVAGSFGLVQGRADFNWSEGPGGVRLLVDAGTGGDPIDPVSPDRLAINPSASLELGPKTDLALSGGYTRIAQLEYSGLPAEFLGDPAVDRFVFPGATDAPPTVVENSYVDAVLTHRFSDRLSAQLQTRSYWNSMDEYGSFPFLAVAPIQGTTALMFKGRLVAEVQQTTVDGSVTAQFATGPVEHVLLSGFTVDRTDYAGGIGFEPLGFFDYANPQTIAFGRPPEMMELVNRYTTDAFYLQDQMKLGRFGLLAGLRWSRLGLEERVGGRGTDESWGEWDFRVGGTFELVEGVNLFAAWSQGSRLTLFFSGVEPPVPETGDQVEGGLKLALPDIGLSGSIAGYRIRRQNVPTPDPLTPFVSVQTGEQASRGLDLDLIWEPSPAVSLLATYAFTDADVTKDNLVPPGEALPRVPRNSGRLAGRYRLLDGPLAGLGFGLGLTGTSGAQTTLPNSFQTDAFVLLDLQASYVRGPFRVQLAVENLANTDYVLPYQYLGQPVVRPGNPRTFTMTMGVTFQ